MNARAIGGKKSCEYYDACGNTENCARCSSYKKKLSSKRRKEVVK